MPACFSLEGSSMLPVFRPGELVLLSDDRPGPGDCAVYLFQGARLLHRVLSVTEKGAWLADDAGRLDRHFVPFSDISGTAVSGGPLSRGRAGLAYSLTRRVLSRLFLSHG
ncbi:MAG: S24/S26 family peptidase [Elusimicrobia bacterium]|nr:S24/S26 family peptidase [Elusimicrobiota bacterium]